MGRRARAWAAADALLEPVEAAAAATCWLCGRPLGHKVEWHHPVPKSRGGRDTRPVHPICHRAIHATFANVELAKLPPDPAALAEHPDMARFLAWIAGKPPDFHARTRTGSALRERS